MDIEPPKDAVGVWEKDEAVAACRNCSEPFTTLVRRHHCRGCGKIFCNKCSDFYITWNESQYTNPQRVCRGCLWQYSAMDYSKTFDVFDSRGKKTILLIPPELGTRQNYIFLAEALSKYYRVVSMDLPGLGSRFNEKLTLKSAINAIREVIEQTCESKTAIIFGYSMGGYLAMHFCESHPEMCEALILGNCLEDMSGFGATTSGLGLGLVYSLLSNEQLTKLFPMIHSSISKDRLNRAYFTSTLNFEAWSECLDISKEPTPSYYQNIIGSFKRKILFFVGENDSKEMKNNFMSTAIDANVVVIPGQTTLSFLHQDTERLVLEAILNFLQDV